MSGFQLTDTKLTAVLNEVFERAGIVPEGMTCTSCDAQTTFSVLEGGEYVRFTVDAPSPLQAARILLLSMPYNSCEQRLSI